MSRALSAILLFTLILIFVFALSSGIARAAIIADHNCVAEFESVPDSVIESIGDDLSVFYIHTSHGSQIVTGLSLVTDQYPLCDPPPFVEYSGDLGGTGDVSWVPIAQQYLDNPSYDFNVAMFSWCGGVSDNTEEGINIYFSAMEGLEAQYPDVVFVYMTGHLDGTGPEGNLYDRNNQIREYCAVHDKVLFDFADIESYAPDGTYYPDASDACEWCYDWCAAYVCPDCSCAHSHCFNCYQKGKVWWWMAARILDWRQSGEPVCGDADGSSNVDIDDIVYLIAYIFQGGSEPVAIGLADANCASGIDIDDVVYLIAYVFQGGNPPCDPDGDSTPDCGI